jgi:hypothetical protein
MIFNTLISTVTNRNSSGIKTKNKSPRNKYISDKYHERSIINRLF